MKHIEQHFKIVKTNPPESTIQALLAADKGILAADESFPTIEKRFKELANGGGAG